jgi:hypothetical protein
MFVSPSEVEEFLEHFGTCSYAEMFRDFSTEPALSKVEGVGMTEEHKS